MSIGSIGQSAYWNTQAGSLSASLAENASFSPAATTSTSGSASTTGTSATGSSSDPFQQLATDLQAALVQLQNGSATTTQGTTNQASATQASATGTGVSQSGSTQPHHHHHHHAESSDQDAGGGSSLQDDLSKLQGDLAQALQSYGASSSFAPTPTTSASA